MEIFRVVVSRLRHAWIPGARSFLWSVLASCLVLSSSALAQLPSIEITAMSPTAVKRGSEVEWKVVAGTRTEEIRALRFSHPALTAEPVTQAPLPFTETPRAEAGQFRVHVPETLAPGRLEVRAVGRHGISNPRILRVVDRPCLPVATVSHDVAHPTPFPPDQLLMAQATPAEVDYFQVRVEKGQPQLIRLTAQGIDSRMLGQLRLLDAQGNTVRVSRGAEGHDPTVQVPADGETEYVLAVHDFLYRGGNEFPYQLTSDPLPASVGDPAAPVAAIAQAFSQEPANTAGAVANFDAPAALGLPPTPADTPPITWLATPPPPTSEPLPIEPPCRIAGRFVARSSPAPESYAFRFEATPGATWSIDVFSQRLGQPTDIRMTIDRLVSPAGEAERWQQVAVADDSQAINDGAINLTSTDPALRFVAPEAGSYRITLDDLDRGDALAAEQVFLLEVRPDNPRFDLLAYPAFPHKDINQAKTHGLHGVAGGVVSLRLLAVRRDGWSGPIELQLEGLPAGATSVPVVLPANQSIAHVNIAIDEAVESWVGAVRVVGRGLEDTNVSSVAVPATIQWGKSATRPFVRARLSTELALSLSPADVAPVTVRLGKDSVAESEPVESEALESKPLEAKPGTTVKVPVRVTRRETGQGVCTFRPQDLPTGITAGEGQIAADQTEGTLELKLDGKVPPGTYTFWVQVETPVKWTPNPQRLQRAQAYRSMLQAKREEATSDAERAEIDAALKLADERIKAAEPAGKPQDLTLFLPSNHTTLRVVSP